MAKFRSVPGTKFKGLARRFDAQGFYETNDPKELEALSKARYVERVDEPKKAEKPEQPAPAAKAPEAPAPKPAAAKKGGK